MLIDCSYFTKGPRHILNCTLGSVGPNGTEVNAQVTAYIEQYQEKYLKSMLGSAVGNRVNAYLVCLDEDSSPKHMADFDAVCERIKESFADYVFFRMLRDMNDQATVTGLVRLKSANSYVSPIRRQVDVWNTMVERNRDFVQWSLTSGCRLHGITVDNNMLVKINTLNL